MTSEIVERLTLFSRLFLNTVNLLSLVGEQVSYKELRRARLVAGHELLDEDPLGFDPLQHSYSVGELS